MRARVGIPILLGVFVLCAVAIAQPPNGVVRPEHEGGLRPLELGKQLFAGNCSSCHGSLGQGVFNPPQHGEGGIKGQGPPLTGAGGLAADFYLRTGYMPLGDPSHQPWLHRDLWSPREIRALTVYIGSLGKGEPIPHPNPAAGSLEEGQSLFTDHCAGCHQVAGSGGIVTGARVPRIDNVEPVEIAEAVRVGPYVMPQFSKHEISDAQLNSLIRYVRTLGTNRYDKGGAGLGHVGPIPEGMITWLVAAVLLVGLCVLLGTRLRE